MTDKPNRQVRPEPPSKILADRIKNVMPKVQVQISKTK